MLEKDWFICCKNCSKRYLGCHDKCEDYQRRKAKKEYIKAQRQKEVDIDTMFFSRFKKGGQP